MKHICSTLGSILLFIFMLIFPRAVFEGASTGLLLWFQTVLPTLLPFIILSNLLIHTGAIDWIAKVISPILCRFFRVSPYGAFAVLTGFLCGCPMGSKVTADLIRKGSITGEEGRYLLSFCNNTSPMFIISFVIWQNLRCEEFTALLFSIVMASPILLSFLFRRYYRIPPTRKPAKARHRFRSGLWLKSLHDSRSEHSQRPRSKLTGHQNSSAASCGGFDPRGSRQISMQAWLLGSLLRGNKAGTDSVSFGGVLDDCIMNGFETITRIGGYMMLFSIILSLAELMPVKPAIVNDVLLPSLEITTGVDMICRADLNSNVRIIRVLALTSFGGWCAAAQTKAMIGGTDLPFLPYIIEKLITALATSLLACILL